MSATSVPGVSTSQSQGSPLIRKLGIYETYAHNIGGDPPPHKIGDRLRIGSRVFFFGRNGTAAALSSGKMCQGAAPVANYLNCVAFAAASKGATRIQVTLGTSAVVSYFNQGYVHVNTGVTNPWICKIKNSSVSATVSGTANVVTLDLYDPIPVALTTSGYLTLTKNPWDLPVVVPNGGLTQVPVGVPIVNIPISVTTGGIYGQGIDYYGWFQTWGPCLVLAQGTIVIANNVVIGGTADGACGANAGTPVATAGPQVISWGQVMRVNASQHYALINLTLFP